MDPRPIVIDDGDGCSQVCGSSDIRVGWNRARAWADVATSAPAWDGHESQRDGRGEKQIPTSGIYALKQNQAVLTRLLAQRPIDVGISVITEAELRTGAAKSASAAKTTRLLDNFLRPLQVVEFTSADAVAYASVRARIERAGRPIGPLDTLIAAQAVARKMTLVSNNAREFERIEGLRLENWASH